MTDYNGVSLIQHPEFTECDSLMSTDSCLVGMGAVTSDSHFCYAVYPAHIQQMGLCISALELLAIVVASRLWGHLWPREKLVIRCDNEPACCAINTGRSRNSFMQTCLCQLWLVEACPPLCSYPQY